MSSIPELYSLQNSVSTGGIQGYHVDKKYYDPLKIKQQRLLSESKQKYQGAKPVNVSKKTTFIDEIQKLSAKLPAPNAYEPTVKQKPKTSEITKPANRKTFIDEITHLEKKNNVPGAGSYSKVITEVDKKKLRPDLSRAESPTYLEASMRNSLDCPGVGNYNSHRAYLDRRGPKWVADPEKQKKKKASEQKLPPVGTYNPKPVSFNLFQSITGANKRRVASGLGGKSERFKSGSKDKKLPFYNILSEWGMKDKTRKKDILSKISSSNPVSSRSVYY